jgi:hypothetical protein
MFLDQEPDNIFRYFRTHHKVTIVKGSSPYHQAAADRLVKTLKPWNIECAVVNAADVNKPRSLTEEEAKTWCGMDYAGKGQIKAGDKNPGVLQESITLIAHDEKGLSEAVGRMFEMVAGMEPLTPLVLPDRSSVTAAKTASSIPELKIAGELVLPDRIVGISAKDKNWTALTDAGVQAELRDKILSQKVIEGTAFQKLAGELRMVAPVKPEFQKKAAPGRLVKFALPNGKVTAVAYWGGTVALVNADGVIQAERRLPQDITAMAWAGENLLVGDADGRLTVLSAK